MAAAPPYPRRDYKRGASPTLSKLPPTTIRHATTSIKTDIERGIKKSATFHSPKSPAAEDDPLLNIPSLSKRSPTCPRALQSLVSSEDRVSQLLDDVDRSLSGLKALSDSQETLRAEEFPVPRFMLGRPDEKDCMEIDSTPKQQQPRHNRHASDSGLGSSITDSEDTTSREDAAQILADFRKSVPSLRLSRSNINGTTNQLQHALSSYACRQIQKHLIYPILQEKSLKSFHPLVTGIPARVGRKEITCLRDLEKVLLYLAPKFTESRSAFLRFCDTSIQCLHTTVEHLNDADQRRPSDRPYTNSYFLDLTEQVRQYAAMISQARERLAAGEGRAGDEETTNSKLSLEGGLGRTGQPAQFVRTSNGRSISMLDGEEVDLDALREEARRAGSTDLDDETLLSMARRKKNAERIMHRCSECDKEFKRPCDLTKHEKTHSRPWKCDDPSCKYHEYGWPTEKERDRHVNDKHSNSPAMFKCQFRPCPYESKRESNCKQHMEKAHGWAYVRSKNNGKKGRKQSTSTNNKTPPTPSTTTPGSHIFEASGSELDDTFNSPYMNSNPGSIAATSPYLMHNAYATSPYETPFNFGTEPVNPALTPQSPFTPSSHRPSFSTASGTGDLNTFDPPMNNMDMPLFNGTFDWSNADFTSLNVDINQQLFTPATSIDELPKDAAFHNRTLSTDREAHNDTKLSPGAQGGMMLNSYTPHEMALDDGFAEFATTDMGKPMHDFSLFDDPRPEAGTGHMSLFENLPPFQSQTWQMDSQMMEE